MVNLNTGEPRGHPTSVLHNPAEDMIQPSVALEWSNLLPGT